MCPPNSEPPGKLFTVFYISLVVEPDIKYCGPHVTSVYMLLPTVKHKDVIAST